MPEKDGFQFPISDEVVTFWKRHGGHWMGASVPDRVYHLPRMRLDWGEYYYAVKMPGRDIYPRSAVEAAMGGPTVAEAAETRMMRAG